MSKELTEKQVAEIIHDQLKKEIVELQAEIAKKNAEIKRLRKVIDEHESQWVDEHV